MFIFLFLIEALIFAHVCGESEIAMKTEIFRFTEYFPVGVGLSCLIETECADYVQTQTVEAIQKLYLQSLLSGFKFKRFVS